MASIQKRGTRWQIRIKDALLPTPFFHTFDTESEARDYAAQLEALLARGIVPHELLSIRVRVYDPLLIEVIRDYTKTAPVTDSDNELLDVVLTEVAGVRVSGVSFRWAEGYVRDLKKTQKLASGSIRKPLAPGTIRKRVGVLARVLDWHIRRATALDEHPPANPLRLLPVGYSAYSSQDVESVEDMVVDVVRDRRLTPAEDVRIRTALTGEKRQDRQRSLDGDPAFALFYALIVDTGLRLSEAYKLRVDMIDFERHVIRVEGSKGHRGLIKPRVLPLKVLLREPLREWCIDRVGLLFPFWDGTRPGMKQASGRLSQRFRALFSYADVLEMTEHDLRHEACCRWMELRNSRGGWVFSEVEICRMMGWTDMRMMLRYASLRGEDLSSRLE